MHLLMRIASKLAIKTSLKLESMFSNFVRSDSAKYFCLEATARDSFVYKVIFLISELIAETRKNSVPLGPSFSLFRLSMK